jgi:hypothetical protein
VSEAIVIDECYCGAPGLANDGYVAGLLATRIGVSADASFRRPVPLGRELQIDRTGDGVSLYAAGECLVEVKRIDLQLPVPAPPSLAEAHAAAARYLGRRSHLRFAHCFGCGVERAEGEGLRIFAGPAARADGAYAAPWVPVPALIDERGVVRPEFVWTALGCSGGFALMGDDAALVLLPSRLAARIDALPRAGEPYIVMAWVIERGPGRHVTGTALFAAQGHLLALGRAQWLEPQVGFRA